jgi:head-tail adaptor
MPLSEKQKVHGSKLVGLTMIPGVQDCITEWTQVNGEYDEWQVLERAWAAVVTYATAHQAQAAQELARCSR